MRFVRWMGLVAVVLVSSPPSAEAASRAQSAPPASASVEGKARRALGDDFGCVKRGPGQRAVLLVGSRTAATTARRIVRRARAEKSIRVRVIDRRLGERAVDASVATLYTAVGMLNPDVLVTTAPASSNEKCLEVTVLLSTTAAPWTATAVQRQVEAAGPGVFTVVTVPGDQIPQDRALPLPR